MAALTHLSTNRNTVQDQVARHPMVAFITLSYAISWISWLLSERFDLGVVNGFGVIYSAGPALAAMMVSALVRPEPAGVPAGKRWRLFGLVGILALGIMAMRRLWITAEWLSVAGSVTTTVAYPTPIAFLGDVLAAGVVAFVLSGVHSPKQGVRDLLHSLDPLRQPVRWYWWTIAVGLYPVIIALGNAIAAGIGLPEHVSINLTPIFLPESSLATYLWLLLILVIAFWMWRFPQTFSLRQV